MGAESENFYYKVCLSMYLMGTPNFWIDDLKLPAFVTKIHDAFWRAADVIVFLWMLSEYLANFTQHNLNEKQKGDLTMFCLAHPLMFSYSFAVCYHRENIKEVMKHVVVNFKEVHNNTQVEAEALKRTKFFLILFACFFVAALVFYGMDGIKDGAFVTVVTAWPDVNDNRNLAKFGRVIIYLIWWLLMAKSTTAFMLIISHVISLSHQYRNLASYFCGIKEIFEGIGTQQEKEQKYENAFKVGIKIHSDTLRCVRLTKQTSSWICGGQVALNVTALILFMGQMLNSERTLSNTITTLTSASALLTATGCFMWNAGDISVEASRLATAMFGSGWHNCRSASARRVRALVTISMWQSQRPVDLKCFGIIKLSYEGYLTIVKSSYSVFSVLYCIGFI